MTPVTLKRYLIDRAQGITSQGPSEIVILVCIDENNREHAFALSKVDAMMMSHQLHVAAIDARNQGL